MDHCLYVASSLTLVLLLFWYRDTPQGRVLLADGQYKLVNGGAIRVKDGRVVWDQYGVVEKFNQGQGKGLLGIG